MDRLPSRRTARLLTAVLVVALVLPTVAGAVGQLGDGPTKGDGPPAGDVTAETRNITFVSAQGSFGPAEDGRVVAIDTDTQEILWEYSGGAPDQDVLYYDVDPLGDGELLVVEQITGSRATAVRIDWREDEVLDRFEVPLDTHDVDLLGGDRYVVADKYYHRAYVYDAGTEEVVWQYNFSAHYPEYPAAGEDPSTQRSGAGGYTHLNDVDAVDNGSAFLLSPRNFDRVVLVDRETKETVWTLGEEDNTSILYKQHNPALLSQDPPTVLVADSENNRVVEYRQRPDGSWNRTWAYAGRLAWPRDADRLPNGNTLIVDSGGQRVLEVTTDKEIVWEMRIPKMPYDVERLAYGDEPTGPPTVDGGAEAASAESSVGLFREVYVLALWVLPAWIDIGAFYGLVGALVVVLAWLVAEGGLAVRRRI